MITDYEYPHRFIDEQQRGPFATWWHEHSFTPLETGGTLMIDLVRFRAPMGPLGLVAERVVLHRYMTSLLRQRNDWLKNAVENPAAR